MDYLSEIKGGPSPTATGVNNKPIDYLAALKSSPAAPAAANAMKTAVPTPNDNPIAQTKAAMTSPIGATTQAAYRGLLSFGSSIANALTKVKDGAAKTALDFLAPLNPVLDTIRPQLNKQINDYMGGQDKTYQENLKQYPSIQAANMIGQFAGSAPLNPLMSGLSKLPGLVGDALPTGLKTAGKYATGAGVGAANAGLYGATSYDPNNKDTLNYQAAKDMATNPINAALGAAGTGASSYLKQTQKLKDAEDNAYGSIVLNRDLKPNLKPIADKVFGSMPLIGDAGRRAAQEQSFIPGVENFIKSLSSNVGDIVGNSSGRDIVDKTASNVFNKAADRIATQEQSAWAPINAVEGQIKINPMKIEDLKNKATNILDTNGAEIKDSSPGLASSMQRFVDDSKGNYTFTDLKNFKSTISNYINAPKADFTKQTQNLVHDYVSNMYEGLDNSIKDVDPSLVEKYHEANAFTSAKYQMFNQAGGDFKKAIADNANSYQFMKKLMSEQSPTALQNMLKPFSPGETADIQSSVLAKRFKDSLDPGTNNLNVSKFLKATSPQSTTPNIVGGDTFNALQGLQTVMRQNVAAEPKGLLGQAVEKGMTLGHIGGAAAGGFVNPAATAGVVASAAALAKISQYSPLKRALIGISNITGNPRLLEKMSRGISSNIQRAGFSIEKGADGNTHITTPEENK